MKSKVYPGLPCTSQTAATQRRGRSLGHGSSEPDPLRVRDAVRALDRSGPSQCNRCGHPGNGATFNTMSVAPSLTCLQPLTRNTRQFRNQLEVSRVPRHNGVTKTRCGRAN